MCKLHRLTRGLSVADSTMRRRIVEFIDDALKPTSDRYALMNTMAKSALVDVNRNGGDLLANL